MPFGDARSVLRGEIFEQPEAVARLLERERRNAASLAARWRRAKVPFVLVAARGTSDNAARYAAIRLRARLAPARRPRGAVPRHALRRRRRASAGALVIGISQSGRSPDVVETIAAARRAGSPTLAIVNDAGSPLARAAAEVLPLHAGEERSIAATKTYTAELAAVALLVLSLRAAEEGARRAPRRAGRDGAGARVRGGRAPGGARPREGRARGRPRARRALSDGVRDRPEAEGARASLRRALLGGGLPARADRHGRGEPPGRRRVAARDASRRPRCARSPATSRGAAAR